jgi:uncharacterized protein (DUF1501 family)
MTDFLHSRRQFLKTSTAVAAAAPAAAFGLQMAAVSGAASQTTDSAYKALVCIFLIGGNDSNNTVLATDSDSWSRYWLARNTGNKPIALMPQGAPRARVGSISSITGRKVGVDTPEAWGGVLPIVPKTVQAIPAGTNASQRTFGIHPMLSPILPLFTQGRLAIVANVGTLVEPVTKTELRNQTKAFPDDFQSHKGQQFYWQGRTEGVLERGWGGRFADLLASANGGKSLYTAMSTAGNSAFLRGSTVKQYQVSFGATPAIQIKPAAASSLFGSSVGPDIMTKILLDASSNADMGADYVDMVRRSMNSANELNTAASGASVLAIPKPPVYKDPISGVVESNVLADQLQAVARMIATAPALGLKRQVFFVAMSGHDTHNGQNIDQPNNLAKLAKAMALFDATLANIGGVDMRNQVTTFTASDFSRTFNTNGDGTDHAWGGHHLVMGGAVKGGDIYGQYPTLGMDRGSFYNPDIYRASMIPTTSVDQYAATLGSWFGVSNADLNLIFPNLRNFSRPNLGFLR